MKLLDEIRKIMHTDTPAEVFMKEYYRDTLEHNSDKSYRVHDGGSSKLEIIDSNTVEIVDTNQHRKDIDSSNCLDHIFSMADKHGIFLASSAQEDYFTTNSFENSGKYSIRKPK